jgi:hypothetical protein
MSLAARRVLAASLACLLCVACLRFAEVADPWPCKSSADCDDDEICRNDRCAAKGTCQGDDECGVGQACILGRCTAVECFDGTVGACGAYACRQHACLSNCAALEDCVAGYGCVGGACELAQCQTADDAVCAGYACLNRICRTECTSDADCASTHQCSAGTCRDRPHGNGATCMRDEQCTSNICCASAGIPTCSKDCVRADDGAACSLALACKSRRCIDGACAPCADEACVAERCGNATCGVHGGMQCGECDEKTYCNFDHCEPACDEQECGESHGVDCGTCPGQELLRRVSLPAGLRRLRVRLAQRRGLRHVRGGASMQDGPVAMRRGALPGR